MEVVFYIMISGFIIIVLFELHNIKEQLENVKEQIKCSQNNIEREIHSKCEITTSNLKAVIANIRTAIKRNK